MNKTMTYGSMNGAVKTQSFGKSSYIAGSEFPDFSKECTFFFKGKGFSWSLLPLEDNGIMCLLNVRKLSPRNTV
jgi:hypothetical protein